jgi:DNA topoisomerase-2
MEITKFLNNEYSDSALYIAYRSLPSYIDGLKNSGRKAIYTIKKRNIKSKLKVSALGSSIIMDAGYLHGDSGIQGTIVTLAADFCGANNLPYIKGEGSFGTRLIPEASAPRYIFARMADYSDEVFRKSDDENLISQEFEGDEIEPRFYVPTLPMLLVNGAEGVGVGFAGKMLARPIENIIKLTKNKLEGKRIKKELLTPGWKGFKGTVIELEPNKYEIKGIFTIQGKKIIIDELPISWDLQKYTELLRKYKNPDPKKPKEKKRIEKYIDGSDPESDIFHFEITLTDEEAALPQETIIKDFGLVETITENPTLIGENNDIKEFNDAIEVFNAYYNIKLEYMEKRKKSEIKRLENEKTYLAEVVRFIKEVIAGTINLKLKKSVVEADMKKKKYVNIDKLISMPLYSITSDKAKEMEEKYQAKVVELDNFIKNETPVTLWLKDIDALEKELKKEGRI